MKHCMIWALVAGGVVLTGSAAVAQDGKTLTVVDGSGKEHVLKSWKFAAGIKYLSWLAPAGAEDKAGDKEKVKGKKIGPQVGPEALEFTEGTTAPLKKRVLTYIPLANIRSIDFEPKKQGVSVRVVKSDKEADDEILDGLTGYAGVNALAITATTDLGDLGTASIEFKPGGTRGLLSVKFADPKPIAPVAGRAAIVKQQSKTQSSITAFDPQALYVTSSGLQRTSPILYFKDTIKLDLAKIQKLTAAGPSGIDFDVTLKSGQQTPLSLIDRPKNVDGKGDLVLEGLVGRFPGGYRFFPMATVGELEFADQGK